MKKSRRRFIKNSSIVTFGIPLLGVGLNNCTSQASEEASSEDSQTKSLSILILGGTSFLGPHQVYSALSKGHKVSIFTRGKTKPSVHQELFAEVEHLVGDRENDLSALENRKWDVVIDNSGRNVAWTKKSATLLKDNVDLYVYTSSTGVYYPYLGDDIDENTPLLKEEPAELEDEDLRMEYWYGVMKTNSEIEAVNAFGEDRTLLIRPTYMLGPADKTDRFIYWPVRLPKGGEILVPGKADDLVQYIDVRDVADWMIRLIESNTTGTFNAVGPEKKETMIEFVNKAKATFDVKSTIVSIDDYDFLKEHKVPYLVPWIMPEGNNYGSSRINNEKAIKAGLTFRDIKNTIKDTHSWWYSEALSDERRNKFEKKENALLQREASIIAKWKSRES